MTASFVDEEYIVLGYSNGLVSLRNALDGSFMYNLNIPAINKTKVSKMFRYLTKKKSGISGYRLDTRVNKVQRLGNLKIFCG